MPKFSIIIPTHGKHCSDLLQPCLESILRNTDMSTVEVIVVANACTDNTVEYVQSLKSSFKVISTEEALGFPKAINVGIKASQGEFIILLNNDTVILDNRWVDILRRPFDSDPEVGITGPAKFFWEMIGLRKDAIAFWCCMFRRTLVDEIGYLDEIYGQGTGEDGDFSIKTELIGYKLVQVPNDQSHQFGTGIPDQSFPIWHKGNGTFSDLPEKNALINRNEGILLNRFGSRLERIYDAKFHKSGSDIGGLFPIIRRYANRCSKITELGVRDVESTYAFMATLPDSLISYDLFASPNIGEAFDIAKESGVNFKFIEADDLTITLDETDLLFIDTLHRYRQLSQEFKMHADKAKKYIILHDTETWGYQDEGDFYALGTWHKPSDNTPSDKQGLQAAIKEFLASNPQWEIEFETKESNGLMVLKRGETKKKMKYSIIIPTYNKLDYLKSCCESIVKCTGLEDTEVIVVANGCTDGTDAYVESLGHPFKLISSVEPLGYPKAINAGLRGCTGEFIILLNNDTVLLSNQWVDILRKPFDTDSDTGITGPCKFFWNYGEKQGGSIAFWCAMFKKSLVDEIGYLDEIFSPGMFEDADYSIRTEACGYKIVRVPVNINYEGEVVPDDKFPVYHLDRGTFGGVDPKDEIKRRNQGVFEKKYNVRISDPQKTPEELPPVVLKNGPKFSIIVPTCNDKDTLNTCIENILQYTDLSDKEIIVAANGCSEETLTYLHSVKNIRVIVWPERQGQIIPVNRGAQEALGEYLIFIDDDSYLLEQEKDTWINKLYQPFNDPTVGMTGVFATEYPYIGMAIHNGCSMYRKDVWDQVGGADPAYGFGYLFDTDLSLRIKEAGYQIIDVGSDNMFPIFHQGSPVTSEIKKRDVALIRENRNMLYNRHAKKPKISIIVPTYGNHLEDCLRPCLDGVKKYTNLEEVEVIVVANGCVDGTADYVDSLGHPFKLVWFDKGLGYTKATNEGIKVSLGEYIILLNNDTVLLEQEFNTWINMLMEPFEKDPMVGITGPLELFDRYAGKNAMIFFCVCIKRSIMEELKVSEGQYLDEIYSPGGGEDIAFSVLAQNAGYRQVVVPDSNVVMKETNVGSFQIFHKGEATFSDAEFPEYGNRIIKENGLRNMIRYNKHIKLNLGSGGVEIPGYLSVDKNDRRASIVMDVMDLELPENSVEEIIASHLFEHTSPYRATELLTKWCRILAPGGKLIMELPNIEALCNEFVKADKGSRYGLLNCIFGAVNTTSEGSSSDITSPHLWGWTPDHMYDHLCWAGFVDIIFLPEQIPHPHSECNMRVEARKPA